MPTYEYECADCGYRFEKFQGINDAPVRVCPRCGKRHVKRLIGAGAGILFKGSGFYATDYRSDGYRRAARAEGSASGGNGSGGRGSSGNGSGKGKRAAKAGAAARGSGSD